MPGRPSDDQNRIFSTNFRENIEKIRFRTSSGRHGTSRKSRATRCQNSSFLRRLATTKTSKKLFGKNSILVVVRALWHVREVESYAPSKFQPPTTLGDHQNVEKTIREKIDFFVFRKSVFRHFSDMESLASIVYMFINVLTYLFI